jgi:hypothetical protein
MSFDLMIDVKVAPGRKALWNPIYALRNGPGESGSAVDHLVTPETLG